MSIASPAVTCPVCGGVLPLSPQDCPHCHAAADWLELLLALNCAQNHFEQWRKDGVIGADQLQEITRHYNTRREAMMRSAREGQPVPQPPLPFPWNRCWSCRTRAVSKPYCDNCGAPLDRPAVRKVHYFSYLGQEIDAHQKAGRLSLSQAHACSSDAMQWSAALKNHLEKERLVAAVAVPDEPVRVETGGPALGAAPPVSAGDRSAAPGDVPRRSLLEILLDPRSIQLLLGLGGALLVLGLVIWLATLGIFENALVVALVLGVGNAVLLAGGWAVITATRYQTAGRALTLLACLVMPLNLWFYDANHLITLGEGRLWVAALVCCVLYAVCALVLRDPMFVYVFVGGVTMTGLLMLADREQQKFWEIASPSALLVVLGLIALHAERAFPAQGEGPFSRRRFGLAFFWSGHVLLAYGLLLLLGAQVVGGWLYQPVFKPLYQHWNQIQPAIVTEQWGKLLALGLVLAGTYAYFYSDLVVRRIGVYIYLAVFTLLWAEVLVIDLFALNISQELAIIVLALTALAANLVQPLVIARRKDVATGGAVGDTSLDLLSAPLARSGEPIGLFLSTLPVLLGVWLHWRAIHHTYQIGWTYVGAMLVTAVSCRIGAHVYRHAHPKLAAIYFFGTAATTLVGAAGLLSLLGWTTWQTQAPLLMLIPILYLVAARLYRGHTPEQPLVWVGHAATVAMLLSSLEHAFRGFVMVRGNDLNLALAWFFAEAALFYALAAGFRKQGFNIYLGTAMACGAVWQLLTYGQFDDVYYTLTFASVGLILLIGYRLAVLEKFRLTGLADPAFQCANALLSLGFTAGILLTLSHLATGNREVRGPLVEMLMALAIMSLSAVVLIRHPGWRPWYVVTTVAQFALMVLVLAVFGNLTMWQKLEITSVVLGLALLVVGHLGWYREQERQNDMVSISLLLGSVLAGLPLAIAVVTFRYDPDYYVAHNPVFFAVNELAMLAVGVLLLSTGYMFQLKSTTLTGATLLLLYLGTLVMFINMIEKIQTAAIWITLGGGAIFAAGLLLSIYRDRLLTLPNRIKRREGIFRVLGWR